MHLLILVFIKSIIFSGYEAIAQNEDDQLVRLAHSKPAYNNVGSLTANSHENKQLENIGSTTYIGNNLCLTSAHCFKNNFFHYEVFFDFDTAKRKIAHYSVKHFIVHPEYKNNPKFDIAILILDKPVKELNGLKINYDFSKHQVFADYQHLLTYVGYGVKIFGNDFFSVPDSKRRARQCHTHHCFMKPNFLGIYSTPYGKYNESNAERPLGEFEAYSRNGMSGGAAINENDELVSIIFGTETPEQLFSLSTCLYLMFAQFANSFIDIFSPMFWPTFSFNTAVIIPGSWTRSVPLGACREWIESVQRQYGEDAHIV